MIWSFGYGWLYGQGYGNFAQFLKIIVEKVCKLSKAMIRDQNEEKLKVYCKGGQENNEFQASLWNWSIS